MNNHHLLLIGQILCVSSMKRWDISDRDMHVYQTHPGMCKHTHLHMKSTYTYGVIPQNIEFLHQLCDHNVLWCEKDFNWEILNHESSSRHQQMRSVLDHWHCYVFGLISVPSEKLNWKLLKKIRFLSWYVQ